MTLSHGFRWAALAVGMASCLWWTGCGMPSAPMPPSLNLPETVADLSAVRTGNEVALSWTMPKRTTDKMLIKDTGKIFVRVCLDNEHSCTLANEIFHPAEKAKYSFSLTGDLVSGQAQKHAYYVEVQNQKQRSAGLSNAAVFVGGLVPPLVTGLRAEAHKQGVVLHWSAGESHTSVRLYRRLMTPSPTISKSSQPSKALMATPAEPIERNLLITKETQVGKALDATVTFGNVYEYRAQYVNFVSDGTKTYELAGPVSEPFSVNVKDIFPPAVPEGLAAVAMVGADTGTAIDLNWQPVMDAALAGYVVYRREAGGKWQRISSLDKPLRAPGFHDANVQRGNAYEYVVTAVARNGQESAKSNTAMESVPAPEEQ